MDTTIPSGWECSVFASGIVKWLIILRCLSSCSYIKPQQYREMYQLGQGCLSSCSYIKPQLELFERAGYRRCLSSCSYIKPQLSSFFIVHCFVVYHLVPTSNHNQPVRKTFLPQLFIILFLHQTTTRQSATCLRMGCLSSCSYIKPQRFVL